MSLRQDRSCNFETSRGSRGHRRAHFGSWVQRMFFGPSTPPLFGRVFCRGVRLQTPPMTPLDVAVSVCVSVCVSHAHIMYAYVYVQTHTYIRFVQFPELGLGPCCTACPSLLPTQGGVRVVSVEPFWDGCRDFLELRASVVMPASVSTQLAFECH